jgi:hypothetical protein
MMSVRSSHASGRVSNSHVRLVAACLVATLAFWAYTQTLLPGVDAGDTGGFQAAVLWPEISARQAYPLYYNLARPFVRALSPHNPARGLNLFSAVLGAAAAGLLTSVTAAAFGSLGAGVVSGVLLAFSYTFWTQAIIAEVYTLHLALIALCLMALHAYAERPTTGRLAVFFAVYAVAFGNHLSMILLFVPFAAFIVWRAPDPRSLFSGRIVMLAIGFALIGALQYWPNLMAVWRAPDAPAGSFDRLAAFWFDGTKADWRESMVLGVQATDISDRLGMWWFDLRQQFGVGGVALALSGAGLMLRRNRAWAAMLLGAFAISTAFALTYNVGDAHVFFLPSHFVTAFFAGAVVTAIPSGRRRMSLGVISGLLLYAGWRGWDTWPAVDRHADRRGEALIAGLTFGTDSRSATLVAQLDWQMENVLLYYGRYVRPELSWVRLADVFTQFPFLVEQAHAASKDVVLTDDAAHDVVAAFGPAFPVTGDASLPGDSLIDALASIPRGAPYVLCLLTPPRDQRLDPEMFARVLRELTGGDPPTSQAAPYQVVAGLFGSAPAFSRSSARPFRANFRLLDEPFTVRMESWLGTDTFRRAGFGHVIHRRDHILIVERGVSLVWLQPNGQSSPPTYAASLFAASPRYRIPAAAPKLARLSRKRRAMLSYEISSGLGACYGDSRRPRRRRAISAVR